MTSREENAQAALKERERRTVRSNLYEALKWFPPEQRQAEFEAAIREIERNKRRQEKLEAVRQLSDEQLEKLKLPE
jgi:hypothetical protein